MARIETNNGGPKPPIHLTDADYDMIADLALGLQKNDPALSKLMFDEIDRALIHSVGTLPEDIVALGSEVEFLDETTGTTRRVQLVLPTHADIEAGRVSVLTPVGAGLIGMKVGGEIDWPYPDGRARILKILTVSQQSPPTARPARASAG